MYGERCIDDIMYVKQLEILQRKKKWWWTLIESPF